MAKSKILKLGSKLIRGEFPELYFRSKEALGRLAERRKVSSGSYLLKRGALANLVMDSKALKEGFAQRFKERTNPRFFPMGGSLKDHDLIKEQFPDDFARTIKIADGILRDKFPIFGGQVLDFGSPPDWFYDPVAGVHSEPEFYADVKFLDRDAVGDSKIVWELSRLKFIFPLAQAHLLTGNDIYALKAFGLVEDWIRKNPPKIGINWNSSLECAFRIYALTWMLMLFKDIELVDDRFAEIIWYYVYQLADHIQGHLSFYFSPNTHLIGEGFGLLIAGLFYPEFRKSREFLNTGLKILREELNHQFTSEGIHAERSSFYHRYSANIYLHVLMLCDLNEITLPRGFREKTIKMIEYLNNLRRPDGLWPQTGDSDGGKLVWLEYGNACDYGAVLSTAAIYFKRPELWPEQMKFETIWLLGEAAFKDGLKERVISSKLGSILYSEAGCAILRSEDQNKYLLFDCGKFGYKDSGHSHADALSFELVVNKHPIFVDPGTYSYSGDIRLRNYFRSGAAHNLCLVDGFSIAEEDEVFKWKHYSDAVKEKALLCPGFDFISASAARKRAPVFSHKRNVFRIGNEYFLIYDIVQKPQNSAAQFLFQTPIFSHTFSSKPYALTLSIDNLRVLVRPLANCRFDLKAECGQTEPLAGWFSPDYGVLEKIMSFKIQPEISGIVRMPLCIMPFASDQNPPLIRERRDDVWSLKFKDFTDYWRFVGNDAMTYLRLDNASRVQAFFIAGIGEIEVLGKTFWKSRRVENLYGELKNKTLHLYGNVTGNCKLAASEFEQVRLGDRQVAPQKIASYMEFTF